MKKVYSDVIQFRGNHYDFGRMQGELLKKSPILPNRKKQWGKDSLNFIIDVKKYYDIIMQFAPNIWDEINGLADSLEMSMLDAVKDFGGYYLQFRRSGCSIFTTESFMLADVVVRFLQRSVLWYEIMIIIPILMKDDLFCLNRQMVVMQPLGRQCKLPAGQMG